MVLRNGVVACLFAAAVLSHVAPTAAQSLTAAMRTDDPRLSKAVTLDEPRIPIGDLLARLTAVSDAKIQPGARDGSADEEVTVFVRDMQVADVMDRLWGLLSYRGAEWRWERHGNPGAYAYRLARPPQAQSIADAIRVWVRTKLSAEMALLISAALATPERRGALAASAAKDLFPDDRDFARILQSPGSDSYWTELEIFAQVVPESARTVLLDGGPPLRIPMADLPASAADFMRGLQRKSGFGRTSTAGPQWIEFRTDQSAADEIPNVCLQVDGVGGPGIFGGIQLQAAFRKEIGSRWQLPGDARDDPAASAVVRVAVLPRAAPHGDCGLAYAERLRRVAEATGVPVFARLPCDLSAGGRGVQPEGKTVREFLVADDMPQRMCKWREHALLVSYRSWYLPSETPPPWTLRVGLRAACEKNRGFPEPKELARAAAICTEDQLRHLAHEFPVMGNVKFMYPFFAWLGQDREALADLLSDRGVPLSDAMPHLVASQLSASVPQLAGLEAQSSLRLVIAPRKVAARGGAMQQLLDYDFQVIGPDQKAGFRFGFMVKPLRFDAPDAGAGP